MFSKNVANWYFKISIKFHSEQIIKDTTLYDPIHFVGGNNEIINIRASCPQTKDIVLDEENRKYIVKYNNLKEKDGEFLIEGKLQNKCKGE